MEYCAGFTMGGQDKRETRLQAKIRKIAVLLDILERYDRRIG
jgi:hypothetical protein